MFLQFLLQNFFLVVSGASICEGSSISEKLFGAPVTRKPMDTMNKSLKYPNSHWKYIVQPTSGMDEYLNDSRWINYVPEYAPASFHDFMSSDEGLSYNYEAANKFNDIPSAYSFQRQNPHYLQQPESANNNRYPISADRLPADSSPPAATVNIYSPANAYSRYLIPEDRLPVDFYIYSGNTQKQGGQQIILEKANDIQTESEAEEESILTEIRRQTPEASQWAWSQRGHLGNNLPLNLMMMMQNRIDENDISADSNELRSFFSDPVTALVATFLPFSMMFAAVLPTLVGLAVSQKGSNSTGAGGLAKLLFRRNGTQFLSPFLNTVGTFTPRAQFGDLSRSCVQKVFCEVTKRERPSSLPLQTAIYEVSTFIDDMWLETFGLRTLVESLKDGNCERIVCSDTSSFERYFKGYNNFKKS